MRKLIPTVVLVFAVASSSAGNGLRAKLHVTRVVNVDEPDTSMEGYSMWEHKVWGYTSTTEYVLSCTDVIKAGETKAKFPCAPMSAGFDFDVDVFGKAIGYPADQPNERTNAWYMIREERERRK